jgi:Fe-S cluster assembly protein SufD
VASPLDAYAAEWERAERARPGHDPAPLERLRTSALDEFMSRGFPTTRDEEWRFTSVAAIADGRFALAPEPVPDALDIDIAALRLPGEPAAELIFVDGRFVAALSRRSTLPPGVRAASLAAVVASEYRVVEPALARAASFVRQPFIALNTAFLHDGAFIELPPNAIVEQPIHCLFIATGRAGGGMPMIHPRSLVVLGPGSQASIQTTYAGPAGAPYFTNAVTELVIGENAVLDHVTLQHESASAYHVGATFLRAQRSATSTLHAVDTGSALARNDVVATLDGEGIDCTLDGLYVADAERLVDNHTTIDHAQPHCTSREIYKGILAERSHGVFNGKIVVRPDAQKTDARQTNRALLLSEDAQIHTKPQLEIFANDVKCTHGAAVGQLDDEALFYLRSRGLSAARARQLLIHGFAADVLARLPFAPVRARVEERIQRHLAGVSVTA